MSVYSHRKQRYCVGGCCSPQLHKIPVFVGVDWNSLVLPVLPCRGRRGGRCVTASIVPSSDCSAQSSFPWARDTGVLLWALLPWPCCPSLSGQADLPGSFPCAHTSNGKLQLIHLLKKGTFTSTGHLRLPLLTHPWVILDPWAASPSPAC